MRNKLVIKGEMTDLNTYITAMNNNRWAGNRIKQDETERVAWEAKAQRIDHFDRRVDITYTIYTKDKRKDQDNLLIYIKYINDGLIKASVIRNDSMRYVNIRKISVEYDGQGPRTEVEIV